MSFNKFASRSFLFLFMTLFAFSVQAADVFAEGPVKKGDTVTLKYTGTLDDGTVFDSSDRHNTPLQFEVGSGQVIPGFDKAVMGMKKGESKKFTIPAKEAYGEHNPQFVQKVDRKELPPGQEPQVGMGLMVGSPDGRGGRRAMITEVTPTHIMIDFNHPLAGKALTFDITITNIS